MIGFGGQPEAEAIPQKKTTIKVLYAACGKEIHPVIFRSFMGIIGSFLCLPV
jgi:hypothetical protein